MTTTVTSADADRLDADDPLATLRTRFHIPDGLRYFDGNSLGALPIAVAATIGDIVEREWGDNLIRSWFDTTGWWDAPLRVGNLIGGIVGAADGQVAVGDSVSVQLFNLLTAAVRLSDPSRRPVIVIDAAGFPTDRYIASSVARICGRRLLDVPMTELAEFLDTRGPEVAAVLAGAVDYRTGELWDIPSVTRSCHRHGVITVWDLCHAAGAVPVDLDANHVDFAVGCTYKFLSGGPGSPAFSYVARRHLPSLDLPLTGWHGHRRPFDFAADYEPAPDISRVRIGTPHLLSMLALEQALSVFQEVPLADVRAKGLKLGDFFLDCLADVPPGNGLEIVTPRAPSRRGSHIAVTHANSADIVAELAARGVICDLRPPNLLRFGINALYTSFADVYAAATALAEITAGLPATSGVR